jgi:hypothetical protein
VASPAPVYLAGHCASGWHDNCRGTYAGQDCRCPCHQTCPCCGQALPAVTHV